MSDQVWDTGEGESIAITEKWIAPNEAYPDGSYLLERAGVVEYATGYYATLYPDRPSPYWHGKPPFVVIETAEWDWDK